MAGSRAADAPENDDAAAVAVKIASNWEELAGAFRLVHQNYLRCGLTRPNACQMRVTRYHLLPTSEVFVGVLRSEVVSTMTLVRDGELGLPMEDIYGREIGHCRQRGLKLAEVSCLADRREDFERSLPLVLRIMSLMAQAAVSRGVDTLVVAVHPRHAKFYERFIGFRHIGQEKSYKTVCDNPAVALVLDLARLSVDHPRAYRRFFGEPFSDEELAYRPISGSIRARMREIMDANCNPSGNGFPAECLPETPALCDLADSQVG